MEIFTDALLTNLEGERVAGVVALAVLVLTAWLIAAILAVAVVVVDGGSCNLLEVTWQVDGMMV